MMVIQYPMVSDLRHALHRYGLARDRLSATLVRTLGIPASDLAALEYLEAEGPLTQAELGERLLLTRGSVSALVDRLERSGRVRRIPHPESRRAVLVELTPASLDAGEEVVGPYHRALDQALEAIPKPARPAVRDALARAAEAAERCVAELRATSAPANEQTSPTTDNPGDGPSRRRSARRTA
jgi:DNA-binding MarR family transcriptional regulator